MCILCGVARPTQTVQMANGELQYVGLFQFAHILSFGLEQTQSMWQRIWYVYGSANECKRHTFTMTVIKVLLLHQPDHSEWRTFPSSNMHQCYRGYSRSKSLSLHGLCLCIWSYVGTGLKYMQLWVIPYRISHLSELSTAFLTFLHSTYHRVSVKLFWGSGEVKLLHRTLR